MVKKRKLDRQKALFNKTDTYHSELVTVLILIFLKKNVPFQKI